jgi:hypothetical protein
VARLARTALKAANPAAATPDAASAMIPESEARVELSRMREIEVVAAMGDACAGKKECEAGNVLHCTKVQSSGRFERERHRSGFAISDLSC